MCTRHNHVDDCSPHMDILSAKWRAINYTTCSAPNQKCAQRLLSTGRDGTPCGSADRRRRRRRLPRRAPSRTTTGHLSTTWHTYQNASRISRKVKRVALATVIVRTIGVVRQNKKKTKREQQKCNIHYVCVLHIMCVLRLREWPSERPHRFVSPHTQMPCWDSN